MRLYCKPCGAWLNFVIVDRWWCCPRCGEQKATAADQETAFERAFQTNQPRRTNWRGKLAKKGNKSD